MKAPGSEHQWLGDLRAEHEDPIMGALAEFGADPREDKLNLATGMLVDADGEAFATETYRRWVREVAGKSVKYLGPVGHEPFLVGNGRELIFGHDTWEKLDGNIIKIQTLGGSNSMAMVSKFLVNKLPEEKRRLLFDPGWPNHEQIFDEAFQKTSYVHEDAESREYDHASYIEMLKAHPAGCPVLLQTCGYNPDGVERSEEQWMEIAEIMTKRELIAILDFAYNGFAEGFGKDNFAVREFCKAGILTFVCGSNSKNAGYNTKLGALYLVNFPADHKGKIIKYLANDVVLPTIGGGGVGDPAFAMGRILDSQSEMATYFAEIDVVRARLGYTRNQLAVALEADWIFDRRGFFVTLATQGFTREQVQALRTEDGIYLLESSRICLGWDVKRHPVADVAEKLKRVMDLAA